MQRIASAGVLVVALVLSLVAISSLNSGSISDSTTSQGDVVSVAAASDGSVVPLVSDEALVRVFGVVAEGSTTAAFAAGNASPEIGTFDTRSPQRTTTTRFNPTTTTVGRPDSSTTTTQVIRTTTTRVPITTTTGRPTATTTSVPVTTTTILVTSTTLGTVPPPAGDKFVTMLQSITPSGKSEWMWDANYFRNLPYASGTGWTDGDRDGYGCVYAFLTHQGQVVGRVTFTRVLEAASYAWINDTAMVEGSRYYDGTVAGPHAPKELNDCPEPMQDYTPLTGPGQLPTVTYSLGGSLLEVRNYKTLSHADSVTFQQVDSTDQRVTVVAYLDSLPAFVVYYESMVPGLVMNSDLG